MLPNKHEPRSNFVLALVALIILCNMAFPRSKKFKCGHEGCTLSFSGAHEVAMHRRTHTINTFAALHHESANSAMAGSETSQPASYDLQQEMLLSYPVIQADGPIDTTSNNDMRFSDMVTGYGANAVGSFGFVAGSDLHDVLQQSGHDSISSLTGPANSIEKEEFHRYTTDVQVTPAVPGAMDTVLQDNLWSKWLDVPSDDAPFNPFDSTHTDGAGEDTTVEHLGPPGSPSETQPYSHAQRQLAQSPITIMTGAMDTVAQDETWPKWLEVPSGDAPWDPFDSTHTDGVVEDTTAEHRAISGSQSETQPLSHPHMQLAQSPLFQDQTKYTESSSGHVTQASHQCQNLESYTPEAPVAYPAFPYLPLLSTSKVSLPDDQLALGSLATNNLPSVSAGADATIRRNQHQQQQQQQYNQTAGVVGHQDATASQANFSMVQGAGSDKFPATHGIVHPHGLRSSGLTTLPDNSVPDTGNHEQLHNLVKLPGSSRSVKFSRNAELARDTPKHTVEKRFQNFQCQTCKGLFPYSYTLDRHLLTHTGERPFRCYICERQSTRRDILDGHIRTHSGKHKGNAPFECPVCERKFYLKHHLKSHIRIHTGGKPLLCLTSPPVPSAAGQLSATATGPAATSSNTTGTSTTSASSTGTTTFAVPQQPVTMAGSSTVNVMQEQHHLPLQQQQPGHQQPEHHHQTHSQQNLVQNPDQSSGMTGGMENPSGSLAGTKGATPSRYSAILGMDLHR